MSAFVVSARKYRPTTFDEVIGQDHISNTLKNALVSDQVAQAFLFTGPRGVGKTTCARILAKILNCQNRVDKVAACNQCATCQAINDNASFNIFELDAASNNSVDNIRTLVEQVRFTPQVGNYKVIILDEVHMLTTAAFNAFLKTLEEPPAHAIFILATTEKHKVIPTILSRCQIFDFKRITPTDTVKQLMHICAKENVIAEEEALHIIATKADGAMRDALSIFDKVASATNNNITYKDVVANLNLLDYENYFKVTDALMRQDLSATLIILDDIINAGFDPEHFLNGLADHFRDLMIAKQPATVEILDVSDELKRKYLQQAALSTQSMLLSGISLLAQCELDLPMAKNKRLHVELALSKLVYLKHSYKGNELPQGAEQEKKTLVPNDSPPVQNPTIPSAQPTNTGSYSENVSSLETIHESQSQIAAPIQSQAEAIQQVKEEAPKPAATMTAIPKIGMTNINSIRESIMQNEAKLAENKKKLTTEHINTIWNKYIEEVESKSTQTVLKNVILALDNKEIHITVPSNLAKEMIIQEGNLIDRLRSECGEPSLAFNIKIDTSQFPEIEEVKPVQSLTQRERYMKMAENNPALVELTKRLELKLDNE
jgi:DNA polymerase III subunit gamma/tau